MSIRGVMFDVDGTLVLSNEAHAYAWVEAFAAFGYTVQFDRILPLIGMGGDKLLPAVFPELSEREGTGKQIAAKRGEIFFTTYLPSVRPAPGARDLVRRMAEDGLRLIIASSAKRDELQVLLRVAKVEDLLTEAVTAEDIEESKPAPDIVQAALQRIGMPPKDAVMLGDTPYDIEAANRANTRLIAVRCGGWDDRHLGLAYAIYDDPADLLAHYGASLFGRELSELVDGNSTASPHIPN